MNSIESSPVFTLSEIQDWWNEVGNGQSINRVCVTDFHTGELAVFFGWEDGEGEVQEECYCNVDYEDSVYAWVEEHMPSVQHYVL